MKTIVLFTNSYPYSKKGEYTFIEPELKVLSKYFNIIIVPLSKETNIPRQLVNNLNNVSVEDVEFNKYKEVFNILKSNVLFIKELYQINNKKHLKDLIIRYIKMKWIENFIKGKLERGEWSNEYIYYTYWFDFTTTALINLKDKFNLKLITRTHRYDLYEERRNGYIPFRKRDVKKINKIVTISMQGFNYLKSKYQIDNVLNSYLGIEDYGIINSLNTSNTIKIVSCALMSPVKRIDLIMEYLSKISNDLVINIEWYHIGNGILENDLKLLTKKLEHKLFKINFIGYLDNKKIFEFYKNNSFDYFITLSASEGLPVSLMESCSVGLPIIATNVGGNSEIVYENKNGFLLSANPTYNEFKEKFIKAIEYKNDLKKFKKLKNNARNIYLEKFNAKVNYEKFVEIIKKL